MPSRDRPRAGRMARAVPRSRGPAGNRVAETDAATDRVPQGIQVRSWGCPFQPFAARGSDAPAGDAPHGRTTLLPLTRRISVRESVGNNVKGRFAVETSVGSRAWVPSERLLVRSVFLGAEAIGHLARRPTGVMQRCGSRGHACLDCRHALPCRMRPWARGRERGARRNCFSQQGRPCAPPDFFRERLAPNVHPDAL